MFDVGMNWVGSVYRKLETMCHDMDEAMRQVQMENDATKFVGNQVQNVGVSVKKMYDESVKMCDELMHELMPPFSTDPVKDKNTKDLSLEKSTAFGTFENNFIKEKTNGHKVLGKTTENVVLPSVMESPNFYAEDTLKESPPSLDLAELVTPAEKNSIRAMSLSEIAEKNLSLQPSSLGTVTGEENPKNLPEQVDGVGSDKLSVPTNSIKEKQLVNRASGKAGAMKERSPQKRKIYRKPRVATGANVAKEKLALSNVNEVSTTSGKDSSQISSYTDISDLPSFPQDPNGSGPHLSLEPNNEAVNCKNLGTICDPANEKAPEMELSNLNASTLVGAGESKSVPEVPCETHEEACNVNMQMLSLSEPVACNLHEEKGIDSSPSPVEHITDESGTCTITMPQTSTFINCPSIELEDDGECADLDAYMALLQTEVTGRIKNSGEEGSGAVKQINEVTEEFHNENLGDSCVVVDNREVAFVFQNPGKQQSYKKKIHDALASRLRSAKKREYEQLAIWCKGIENQEKAKSSSLSSGLKLNTRSSQTYDQQESEWEIL